MASARKNTGEAVHKENEKIHKIPNIRTYEEVATENEYLGRRVLELLTLVAEMEKEKDQLKEEISDLNDNVINSLVAERDEQCESKFQYMDQLEECRRKINELEHERDLAKRQSELKKASDHSDIAPNSEEKSNVSMEEVSEPKTARVIENKVKTSTPNLSPTSSSSDSGIAMDLDLFKNHIESFKLDMERKIENFIDERLDQKQFAINNSKPSSKPFGKPIQSPSPSLQIPQEIPERYPADSENDRKRNIIIHGLEEGESSDKEKIDVIFRTTNTEHNPVSIHRLGAKQPGKSRPIMVRLQTVSYKEELMSKLWMLKQVKTKFKRLSITNDYTANERKVIKDYVEEAKKRNMNGAKEYVWKVRGTPTQGMRLIKIPTQE